MKKILSIMFLFALLASSCSEDEIVKNQSTSSTSKIFTASFEQNESRTYIEDGNLLRWTAGDQISLFDGNTLNRQYQFDGETGDNSGTFTVVSKPYGTGNDLRSNYAVYPYAKEIKITEKGIITVTLPAEQNYAENSFGLGANTMVAVTKDTEDTYLKFKNVGGYLKLQLYGDDVTVKTIKLTGNNNEKLAGQATITSVYGQAPTISMADDATEIITLDCGKNGVKIGSNIETATVFWMVVPPASFESGIEITITDINGGIMTKSTTNKITIERNIIKPMSALEVQPQIQENEIPYLTFSADTAQSLTMSKAVATLEYSVGGSEWKELGTNTVNFGGENGVLRLRGKSSIGTANSRSDYSSIKFGNNVLVSCTGDIRTLIDYEMYSTINTNNARFCNLFYRCSKLITAPKLPATALADDCYVSMFSYCNNLTTAPELPATTLTKYCYQLMFYGCTSLVFAPHLPATTLAFYCYGSMFGGCTNLTSAPELPATSLTNWCYSGMFKSCTNLTSAPKLPATILADYCYADMFWGCSNLIHAPKLPATTLANYCYAGMFNLCSNLEIAPKLPATTLASNCYRYMFSNCTSLATAPELPATTLADNCYESMFRTCTTLTSAPKLPATTLTEYCYYYMFSGCSSLTTAPELPATTLAAYCYKEMFSNCSSLTIAPELPAKELANSCYSDMFGGCTSLATTPQLPAKSLTEYCYKGMFSSCSNLTTAPELPATMLAKYCYKQMFYGCTKLTNVPKKLPATSLANSCYAGMFYRCTSLTTAPELPAKVLVYECYSSMFSNCRNLTNITMLATDIIASLCLSGWVESVASTGTFIKSSNMEALPKGVSGIPYGWTVKNYKEE